ncbi:hypothetical protein Tco_1009621 [Tanacetum coccineum]
MAMMNMSVLSLGLATYLFVENGDLDSWLTIRKGSSKELHNITDLAEEKLRYISRIASYLSKVENFRKLEMKGFEFFGPGDIHLFPISVKTKLALGLKENIAEGAATCVFFSARYR